MLFHPSLSPLNQGGLFPREDNETQLAAKHGAQYVYRLYALEYQYQNIMLASGKTMKPTMYSD